MLEAFIIILIIKWVRKEILATNNISKTVIIITNVEWNKEIIL